MIALPRISTLCFTVIFSAEQPPLWIASFFSTFTEASSYFLLNTIDILGLPREIHDGSLIVSGTRFSMIADLDQSIDFHPHDLRIIGIDSDTVRSTDGKGSRSWTISRRCMIFIGVASNKGIVCCYCDSSSSGKAMISTQSNLISSCDRRVGAVKLISFSTEDNQSASLEVINPPSCNC